VKFTKEIALNNKTLTLDEALDKVSHVSGWNMGEDIQDMVDLIEEDSTKIIKILDIDKFKIATKNVYELGLNFRSDCQPVEVAEEVCNQDIAYLACSTQTLTIRKTLRRAFLLGWMRSLLKHDYPANEFMDTLEQKEFKIYREGRCAGIRAERTY
jgi:hypothetical protein